MSRKRGAEVASGDEQGHQAKRRSTARAGAGKGGSLRQLQKVGDAITQEQRKHNSIPPDEPVNQMAPSKPKARASDKTKNLATKEKQVYFLFVFTCKLTPTTL